MMPNEQSQKFPSENLNKIVDVPPYMYHMLGAPVPQEIWDKYSNKNEVKNLTASLATATAVVTTTVVSIIKNITEENASRLNLLANSTAVFDSNIPESTNWITVAAVGTAVVLGGVAIAGGGWACYKLHQAYNNYNNSLSMTTV